MIHFGRKIKTLREHAKMTQTELANEIGVSKSVISAYEKGIRNPSFKVLQDIAIIFNVPETFFLESGDGQHRDVRDVTGLTLQQLDIIDSLIRHFKVLNYKLKEKQGDIDD